MLASKLNQLSRSLRLLSLENRKNFVQSSHKFSELVDQKHVNNTVEPRRPVEQIDFRDEDTNYADINWKKELDQLKLEEQKSVLEPKDKFDPNEYSRNLKPTFNLAAYVNKSQTLSEFIKLGVDLNRIERRKGLPQYIMKLDFETDVKPYLIFLHDIGIPSSEFSAFITKNPLIFKENFDDLKVRINYLESKRFTQDQIVRIVGGNPFWLMFSTKRIDRRLGWFQKQFKLDGNQVRLVTVRQPKLITYKLESIRKSYFTVKEEMGFTEDELKQLVVEKPKIFLASPTHLINRFDFAHIEMKLSHNQIVQNAEILVSREYRLKQRHQFLEFLNKAQYDPTKDLYISPKSIVEDTDPMFVTNVAKSNLEIYNTFLKSL